MNKSLIMNADKLYLTVGGLKLGFIVRNAAMRGAITRRYQGYLRAPFRPDLTIDCTFSQKPIKGSTRVKVSFDCGEFTVKRRDFACRWQGAHGSMEAALSIYAFDGALRVICATLGPHFGCLFVHSSGIVVKNHACLFAGVSGAGKTTISRISQAPVLNDEILAVRLGQKGKCQVYGTPFWGEMGTGPVFKRSYPLLGIFFLNKAPLHRVETLEPALSLPSFLRCVCFFEKTPDHVKAVTTLAFEVIMAAGACNLYFKRDKGFLEVIVGSNPVLRKIKA